MQFLNTLMTFSLSGDFVCDSRKANAFSTSTLWSREFPRKVFSTWELGKANKQRLRERERYTYTTP